VAFLSSLTLLVLGAFASTSFALVSASTDTSDCTTQNTSMPFLPLNDSNSYFLAPGGGFTDDASTAAAGWQLSGGAALVTTTRPDGTTGSVLDMPSKSVAVSPIMCITSDYPKARMWVRNVVGGEGIQFYVSYVGTSSWTTPKNTGQVHGGTMKWQAPSPVNLQPSGAPGWQKVKFTFIAGGTTSRFQLTDVWVDPRMR
jgi:hypothetical protein